MLDVFHHRAFHVTSRRRLRDRFELRFSIRPDRGPASASPRSGVPRSSSPRRRVRDDADLAGPTGASGHDGGAAAPRAARRVFSVMEGVRDLGLGDEIVHAHVAPAALEDLERVHDGSYLDELEQLCRQVAVASSTRTPTRGLGLPRRGTAGRGCGLSALAALEERGEGIAFVPVRPPGPPRARRSGHGVLPPQQRGGGSRLARCQGPPRPHRRLGRAPWQRHAGPLLERTERAVRLDAPVAPVPRDGAS